MVICVMLLFFRSIFLAGSHGGYASCNGRKPSSQWMLHIAFAFGLACMTIAFVTTWWIPLIINFVWNRNIAGVSVQSDEY
ncbi:unnamed protein product [Eruca vesicaria subsp. sativa]|uniref:Uncharacterized protein n=1 Tax=Eruca vesicaria subsp. sativa TaxID=29727 RepID=A0ABC8KLC7_ERUVS|nr:unnamed protein product [Eruca vesicaria subsp. sativa]